MSRAGRSRLTVEAPGNPDIYMLPSGAPSRWEVIGTVTDADGTGALIRNKSTGVYCRYNAGAIRSLVQRKVQAAIDAAE
ncbi:hypothetical protein ABE488_09165 [Luteimonas sp. TWI662]|uniref:hypothetical protein n=1 Tax=Luteimonas sp. TWI662 TaxID=3136789 RepID=UPI00320AB82F